MPIYKIDPNANRIKIFFEGIPSVQTRTVLKQNHWRWDPREKCWYNHSNASTLKLAEHFCSDSSPKSDHQRHETIGIFTKGTCGSTTYWMFSPLGQLMIGGYGLIQGYSYGQMNKSPWHRMRDQVKQIKIMEGVTEIGERAFCDFVNLETVELPLSLRSIGERVFSRCTKLKSINLPEELTSIGALAFRECLYR